MKTSVYEVVTERILARLAEGTVPWRKTWAGGSGAVPRNFVTKKEYRGINVLLLWSCGFSSPDFLTFNQAKTLGGSVRKGEHGIPIVFWRVYDDDGKTDPKTGKPEKRFVLRYYTVFHVSQCEGLDVPEAETTTRTIDKIEACERAIESYKNPPEIRHGNGGAFYAPSRDLVEMPARESFESPAAYYSTLFHELGHSTGAANRLARKGIVNAAHFGSHAYSFEELVAECTAAFLCAETGIDTQTIENTASYIANWIRVLKSEPRWVVDAAAQAAKAADLILAKNRAQASDEDTTAEAA